MAKKAVKGAEVNNEEKALTVSNERTVVENVSIRMARLVDDSSEVTNVSGLPAEFEDSSTLAGFAPSAKFEKKGDCVFGTYVGMRENVGPNSSRLYELMTPQGGDKPDMAISVWGSTALDRVFDSAYPTIQQGDRLAFIFIGEKETKRAKNPVKLFALKVKYQTK